MLAFKPIFTLFVVCNIFGVLLICYNQFPSQKSIEPRLLAVVPEETETTNGIDTTYKFIDPVKAYHILEKIDKYEGFKGQTTPAGMKPWSDNEKYAKFHFGLTQDANYCQKHRAHFVNNPEQVFDEYKFVSDNGIFDLLRVLVVQRIGNDIMPIGPHMPKPFKKTHMFDIRADANIFYCNVLYLARRIGSEFSCTTQMSNHVPGHHYVYRKDYAAEALVMYGNKYESDPDCFSYDNFFPRTWVLYKEDQCKAFFNEMNSENYQKLKKERNIVYIRKIGAFVHEGKGVELVDNKEEASLRAIYGNGEKCGKVSKNYVVQYFVHNPLLLEGHKFDFRMYMLVASTNPLIAYYHDGFMRVSLHKYTSKGSERGMFITNTALSKSLFTAARNNGTYNGMTEAELKDFQMWLFDDLQTYLLETKVISDPNWLDNYLRPSYKKAMIHLMRMSQGVFLQTSSIYELLGLDFMLDADLNLWFIEANIYPALMGGSPKKRNFMVKMLSDHFEIVGGLLRSRTKRIIAYVNELILQSTAGATPEDINIGDVEQRIKEFREISKNYFEPEFVPKPGNGFSRIIDDNLTGSERYSGLIPEKCF